MLWSRLARMAVATAAMALALWAARDRLAPVAGGHVSVVALGMMVTLGVAVYGAAAAGLGLHRVARRTAAAPA
jgi:hypothetical protein